MQVQSAFLLQTPTLLSSAWNSEPDRLWGPLLFSTKVPIFWAHAHMDGAQPPKPALEWLDQVDRETPVRVMISTGGHLSPANTQEDFLRRDLRIRWFDRFLWDIQNQVEFEDGFDLAPFPLDPSDLNDQTYAWDHRRYPSKSTTTGTTMTRYYLDSAGKMSTTEPPAGPSFVLQHTVPQGFDAAFWAADPTISEAEVLAQIPLSEIVYQTDPLPVESELAGRASLNLWVAANSPNYQVAAVIEALPPSGPSVQLGAWGRGVLNAQIGVPVNLVLNLPPLAAVLPAGTVLRLNIRNHWLLEPPMTGLEAVPYFDTATTLILHGPPGGQQSTIDLPFREVGISLKSQVYEMDATAPVPMDIELYGGEERAFDPYAILVGISGQLPGTQVPGGNTMPVNMDAVTTQLQQLGQSGSPYVIGLTGTFDGQGKALAQIDWTGLPNLVDTVRGNRVIFAAWSPQAPTSSVSSAMQLVVY